MTKMDAGEGIDERDASGYTALATAVTARRAEMVQRLLERGAALEAHDPKIVETRFAKLGPDAAAGPRGASSLLHLAARHSSGAVVRLLVARGLDVDAPDDQGSSPLHFAAAPWGSIAPETALAALLALGAKPQTTDRLGMQPIDCACQPWAVEALLAAGADPNGGMSLQPGVHTVLYDRAQLGLAEVLEVLLRRGADPSRHPGAVAIAAHFGHHDAVRVLLDHGAEPDDQDRGAPALAAAAAFAHLNVVEVLLAAGAKDLDRALACACGESILSASPDLSEDLDRRVALVRLLLARGADPNAPGRAGSTWTPLHWAARGGAVELVDLLVGAGAELEAQDVAGETPLFFAAQAGCLEVVERLLAAGARPRHANHEGVTPFGIAKKTTTPDRTSAADPRLGQQMQVMRALRAAGGAPREAESPPEHGALVHDPKVGERVRHATFGEGTIVRIEGAGTTARLSVDFEGGRKLLAPRFVRRLGDA